MSTPGHHDLSGTTPMNMLYQNVSIPGSNTIPVVPTPSYTYVMDAILGPASGLQIELESGTFNIKVEGIAAGGKSFVAYFTGNASIFTTNIQFARNSSPIIFTQDIGFDSFIVFGDTSGPSQYRLRIQSLRT